MSSFRFITEILELSLFLKNLVCVCVFFSMVFTKCLGWCNLKDF